MCGEHRGQPANLPPSHRVRLAGDAEWSSAGLANAPGGEVDVDDRVALVGAGHRLVRPLAEQGYAAWVAGKQVVERLELCWRNIARLDYVDRAQILP